MLTIDVKLQGETYHLGMCAKFSHQGLMQSFNFYYLLDNQIGCFDLNSAVSLFGVRVEHVVDECSRVPNAPNVYYIYFDKLQLLPFKVYYDFKKQSVISKFFFTNHHQYGSKLRASVHAGESVHELELVLDGISKRGNTTISECFHIPASFASHVQALCF